MRGLGLGDGLCQRGAGLRHQGAAAGGLHGSGATGRGGDFRGSGGFATRGRGGVPWGEGEDLGQLVHLARGHGHVPLRAAGNDVDVRRFCSPVAVLLEHGEGGGGVWAGLDASGGGYLRVDVRGVDVDLVFGRFRFHAASSPAKVHLHEVVGELYYALSGCSVCASDSGVADVVSPGCAQGAGGFGGPQGNFGVVVHQSIVNGLVVIIGNV